MAGLYWTFLPSSHDSDCFCIYLTANITENNIFNAQIFRKLRYKAISIFGVGNIISIYLNAHYGSPENLRNRRIE